MMREIKKEVIDETPAPENENYQLYFVKVEENENNKRADQYRMTVEPTSIPESNDPSQVTKMREIKKEVIDETPAPENEVYQLYFIKVEETEDDERENDQSKMTMHPTSMPDDSLSLPSCSEGNHYRQITSEEDEAVKTGITPEPTDKLFRKDWSTLLSNRNHGLSLPSSSKGDNYQQLTPGEDEGQDCNVLSDGRGTFSQKSNLNIHLKTHTGEQPHQCLYCSKTFSQKSTLIGHLKTHTGEKPHECSYCCKMFALISNLNAHVKRHNGEKPYRCSDCSKTFRVKRDLKRHLKTHTGEKPHQCSYCSKTFSEKSTLKGHLKTHTGEKPYLCSYCDDSRNLKSSSGGDNYQQITSREDEETKTSTMQESPDDILSLPSSSRGINFRHKTSGEDEIQEVKTNAMQEPPSELLKTDSSMLPPIQGSPTDSEKFEEEITFLVDNPGSNHPSNHEENVKQQLHGTEENTTDDSSIYKKPEVVDGLYFHRTDCNKRFFSESNGDLTRHTRTSKHVPSVTRRFAVKEICRAISKYILETRL